MSAEGAALNPVTEHEAELTLSDGVQLRSRLWHPQRGGPWPALVMRQPYGRSIASTVTYAHPRWWAEQGYLVVVQDEALGNQATQSTGAAWDVIDAVAAGAVKVVVVGCRDRSQFIAVGLSGHHHGGDLAILLELSNDPVDGAKTQRVDDLRG